MHRWLKKNIFIFPLMAFFIFLIGIPITGRAEKTITKTVVLYYSRTGTTKMVAEKLAKQFNADLIEVIDKKNRRGFRGYLGAAKDALAQATTTIEPLRQDPLAYDLILIGTPGWFSNMTPAIRTLINETDFSTKALGVFGTSNKTGIEDALNEVIAAIDSKASVPIPKLPLTDKTIKDKNELDKAIALFYDRVMKNWFPREKN